MKTLFFMAKIFSLSIIFLSALSNAVYSQENILALEYGIIYTLPKRTYLFQNGTLHYPYQNPAERKVALQFTRSSNNKFFYGAGTGFESYDFGLKNSFNHNSQDSNGTVVQNAGATARSSDLNNNIYKLNLSFGKEWVLYERSSIMTAIQPAIFYYFHNKDGNDTSKLNDYIWQSRGSVYLPFIVITEEVKQRPGLHFALAGSIGYRYKLGKEKRWGLNATVAYQQGFGYFIKYRQRLFNLSRPNDFTIVEHSLNGTSLQFHLGLSYHFGKK